MRVSDPGCPDGFRYSDVNTGDGLSGECVPMTSPDAMPDTPAVMHTLTVMNGGSGTGTVTSTPNGLACSGGTCTASFADGASVQLGQSASSGTFLGWSNDCLGAGTCAITMDSDHTVTALFGTPGEALWSQQIGGTGEDLARKIVTDSHGDLIVTGTFSDTVNAVPYESLGITDIFVAKLAGSDGSIVWFKTFGGVSEE